jgi:hypothetical protein
MVLLPSDIDSAELMQAVKATQMLAVIKEVIRRGNGISPMLVASKTRGKSGRSR